MRPATIAAGFQFTKERTASQHPHALTAGAKVSATLVDTTGPHNHVTGLKTTPIRVPEVLDNRLAPKGTFTAWEKKRLAPCATAQAGQAMNHTSCAGSPHAQVRVDDGWPLQTCHHRAMAGSEKSTIHTAWRHSARTTRYATDDSCAAPPSRLAIAGERTAASKGTRCIAIPKMPPC